ncbi:MAG TPA: protein translocase subunit SecF [Polyangiaceae bacterium]|nr:protein translocase subunit SecF [Polyangiaceae bacterium]
MHIFPVGKLYNFMGQQKLLSTISFAFVILSIVALFYPGPVMGTDFKGGTEVELAFKSAVTDDQIRNAVHSEGFASPDVIRVRDEQHADRFLIRVQEVSTIGPEAQATIQRALCFGEGLDAAACPAEKQATEVKFSPGGDKITIRYNNKPDLAGIRTALSGGLGGIAMREGEHSISVQNERENRVEVQLKSKGDQLIDALKRELGADVVPEQALRVEWVGPKAGALLRDAALKSVAVAVVFIMIYIALRFDLRFAPGAVIALVHDVIATLGILIFFHKELSLTTVAALLTIVGYSVNDTVIVYDRIRENLGKMRGTSFTRLIDVSLSEMLGRTVLSSSTVVFSLSAFLFWGTGPLKDFAFALILGILLGTYSSIYVALPLTYWLDKRFFSRMGMQKKAQVVRPKKAAAIV